jgi:hypothetical protein
MMIASFADLLDDACAQLASLELTGFLEDAHPVIARASLRAQ